jgi:hypothetical protein
VGRGLARWSQAVLVDALRRAGHAKGRLAEHTRVGATTETPTGLLRYVTTDSREVPYAIFHYQGSRAHVIFPRRKRALRFQVGGRVIFATIVHHPGTKANPYLTDALPAAVRGA